MQRLLFGVWSALLTLCCLASVAAGQSERIFLIGGNYRLQTTFHNMQDGFLALPRSAVPMSRRSSWTRVCVCILTSARTRMC